MDKLVAILSWAVVIAGSAVCIAGGVFLAWVLLDLVGRKFLDRIILIHGFARLNRAAEAIREGKIK